LKLLGMGGSAEAPGAARAVPAVDADAPVVAAPAAAPAVAAPAAVAATGAIAAAEASAEPATVEAVAPEVEEVAPIAEAAPAVAASAAIAAAEAEAPAEQPEAPVAELAAVEAAEEQPAVKAAAVDLDQLKASLDEANLAALQQKVEFVEGIGPVYGGKLIDAGVETVLDLLSRGATRKGRAELVEATGIAAGLVMKWVNQADLFRVKGVGKQFGELLEAAGVDTVPELAQRNPLNLFNKLSEVNAEKKLAGRSPFQSEVESWVAQAKDLPRVIEY
jgi:predicted flap endonuclease-1-like 5' DNA nuclease